jgi:hypothetical protein
MYRKNRRTSCSCHILNRKRSPGNVSERGRVPRLIRLKNEKFQANRKQKSSRPILALTFTAEAFSSSHTILIFFRLYQGCDSWLKSQSGIHINTLTRIILGTSVFDRKQARESGHADTCLRRALRVVTFLGTCRQAPSCTILCRVSTVLTTSKQGLATWFLLIGPAPYKVGPKPYAKSRLRLVKTNAGCPIERPIIIVMPKSSSWQTSIRCPVLLERQAYDTESSLKFQCILVAHTTDELAIHRHWRSQLGKSLAARNQLLKYVEERIVNWAGFYE